jgi:hypothetical protein
LTVGSAADATAEMALKLILAPEMKISSIHAATNCRRDYPGGEALPLSRRTHRPCLPESRQYGMNQALG